MTNDQLIERIRSLANDILNTIDAMDPLVVVPMSDEGSVAAPAKTVTLEDVRAALTDLTSAKGAVDTKQLLAEYGAKKLSDITVDKYATLLADAKAWAGE